MLGSNPSAVPGAKTEWGGTMPPSSFGIGTKAINPSSAPGFTSPLHTC
jgi:hypothetical protein